MSHVCGRTSSAKDKASTAFYRKIKPASKDALPTGKAGTDCKCGKCCKPESQHRIKKLRSRKERNQIRDGGKEAPRNRSYHHYYNHQISKGVSYVHQCCHNTLDACPNIAPVTHEPSVITDSRLIGHHGLFNHEVKSIDIERLLSEQRKLDRSKKRQEKNTFANHPANETECLLDSANDEATISNKKALPTPKIFDNSKRGEKKTTESNSQGSDLTPGQRPRKALISSTEMNKKDNSNVVITEIKETQPAVYENNSDSRQTPCSFNENNTSFLPGSLPSIFECTPKKPTSTPALSQVRHSTPPLPSSPPTAGTSSSLNTQQENVDADSVAMSVKAIAASLCNGVSFSLLKENKNLVAERREALVKALRQRHGAQFKSNILKVQRQLYSYEDDGQGEISELSHSPIFADRKESPFSTGEFLAASKAADFATSSFEKTGRLHFDWNTTDWSNPLDPTAEWLGSLAENPVVPDGPFSHTGPLQFSEDFEFRNSVSRKEKKHLSFAPSGLDGLGSSGHADNFFISTRGKEFVEPESTKDNMTFFIDPLHSVSYPQMHNSFETCKYSYGKTSSDEIPYFYHGSTFEPSRDVHFPSSSSAFRPVDLAHYPPSHIVERGPILSTSSSFPSPEHWSFPPMRLY